MKQFTRRQLLTLLGATTLFSATGGFATLAIAQTQKSAKETRAIMDTFVSIELRDSSADLRKTALTEAFKAIEDAVLLFDRYNSTSPLAILNEKGVLYDTPKDLLHVVQYAKEYATQSKDIFNPTVQPFIDYLLNFHSYDKHEFKQAHSLVRTMDDVQVHNGRIEFRHDNMGMTLDGIAKGYIVDKAVSVLSSYGIQHYMINAGGDIAVQGQQQNGLPWTIGIQEPNKANTIFEYCSLSKGAIATSGGYERYNINHIEYNHLINPYTAQSPQFVRSVTVIAPTATQADALATTISLLPTNHAVRYIEKLDGCACCIKSNNSIIKSAHWNTLAV